MEIEVNNVNNMTQECHKVFNNNPIYFKSLLNKNVEIITVDNKTHVGKVFVIDPVSESIVTVTNKQGTLCNISIHPGHAIKSLKICDYTENETNFELKKNCTEYSSNELINKKEAIKSWLIMNLVDIKEDGMSLKLGEELIIEPPYDSEHCFCSNSIILQRVRNIINKMSDLNT